MEETLNVYQRPPDPERPLVCFDEASKQLVDHVTVPIEAGPGHPTRIIDYEYLRNGTANILLPYAPVGRTPRSPRDRPPHHPPVHPASASSASTWCHRSPHPQPHNLTRHRKSRHPQHRHSHSLPWKSSPEEAQHGAATTNSEPSSAPPATRRSDLAHRASLATSRRSK